MDPVEDVLTAMRIEQSRYLRVEATAPWGIAFHAPETTRLVLIASGSCVLTADALPQPRRLTAGDCFVVQATTKFALEDEPGRPLVECETLFPEPDRTVATHGGPGARTDIVSGRFSFDTTAAEPLFAMLPPLFVLDLHGAAGQQLRATFELLAREDAEAGLGSGLVTSRLADVLFVQAIRAFCETGGGTLGWLAAQRDPRLAAATRALHADLAHPWTVEALAREAGLSRSAFAAAFRAVVGETPLGYLTSWRLHQAKRLLHETDLSVAQIAARVGYESNAALTRVFRRREGTTPGAWRRR
ncbi:AraC family transcriptional regulator [Amycolatopsis rhabdoformis]|uniref:AraC family transcriptional regulator n=1 Tax=Amycolatopsis rhabdoformis TaxID=1448059 RepID=A0ABZ1IG26_9PSEU|nr:AraC family transcriptional regulator [Amycolatopsis rhabdoformis]WSE32741.1 AraC family transcriptional regulator [Amycolatopsis rhabdoformis]